MLMLKLKFQMDNLVKFQTTNFNKKYFKDDRNKNQRKEA